jgi:hypothetical protein
MLTVEHLAAEALRHERLRANAATRSKHHSLRWVFEIFGWRAPTPVA